MAFDRRNPSDGNEHLRREMERIRKKRGGLKSPETVSKGSPATTRSAASGSGALAALGSDTATEGALAGGMAAGPMGAVAGGALGLVKGIAAQKKKKRELKAASIKEQGANIQATAKEKNSALKNIMDGLKAAFLG